MTVTRPIASSRDEMLWEIRRELANIALPVIVGVGAVAMLLAEGLGWPRSVHFFSPMLLLFPLLVWLLARRSYLLAMWLLVLGCALAGFLLPIIWMVSTSLQTSDQVYTLPPSLIPIGTG